MKTAAFGFQSTPKSIKGLSKKEGSKRKINMSGYILFSSEMRAVIKAQHPDFSFGELSRLVGTEWRNLESTRKAEYEGERPESPTSIEILRDHQREKNECPTFLFPVLQSEQLKWLSSRSARGPSIRPPLEQVPQ